MYHPVALYLYIYRLGADIQYHAGYTRLRGKIGDSILGEKVKCLVMEVYTGQWGKTARWLQRIKRQGNS